MEKKNHRLKDSTNEGKDKYFMDIDRMINDELGGGNVTREGGLIEETSVDTMDDPDSK